jgi:biopolymer transport protein ExbD
MKRKRAVATAIFTDVAFILLLFFLVFAIASQRSPFPLDLPLASHAQDVPPAAVRIFVDKNGTLYRGDQSISLDQVEYAESVSLYADAATDFSVVLPILHRLALLGVPRVQCGVEVP